jgi:hypothetical protein
MIVLLEKRENHSKGLNDVIMMEQCQLSERSFLNWKNSLGIPLIFKVFLHRLLLNNVHNAGNMKTFVFSC